MYIACAVCSKNYKSYDSVSEPNDTTSWVCTKCYKEMQGRVRVLKKAVDELNMDKKLKKASRGIDDIYGGFGIFG